MLPENPLFYETTIGVNSAGTLVLSKNIEIYFVRVQIAKSKPQKLFYDNSTKTFVSEFSRTKNIQIEYFNSKTDTASVRWINDCEMIFKTLNPKNRAEQKDVHLKILSTTKDAYTFEYGYVGSSIKQKGRAKRID